MNVFILRNARLESNAGLLRILDANVRNGYQVSVISRNREKSQKKNIVEEKYNYHGNMIPNYVVEIDSRRGAGLKNVFPLIKYQFILFYLLFKQRKKIDILHVLDLDTGLVSLVFSKLFRKKIVYHIADFYADSRLSFKRKAYSLVKKLEFFVINHSDATIIANENRKMQIKGSRPKRLSVIHNAPMISRAELKSLKVKNQKELANYGTVISYVGGLTEQRFINEILDFGLEHPEFTLVLAGYGPLEAKVSSYAKKYDNIYYLGELSYEDSLAVYAQTDLMFAIYDPKVPNHKYSAPNKVYEAMMFNKPIIVAENSGVDQLVKEEQIGLVTEYNLEDFTDKIKNLVANEQQMMQMKENLEEAYFDYSWDKMVDRLENLYQSI